eukprot:6458621-Amphidinium_carterae.1
MQLNILYRTELQFTECSKLQGMTPKLSNSVGFPFSAVVLKTPPFPLKQHWARTVLRSNQVTDTRSLAAECTSTSTRWRVGCQSRCANGSN